MKKALKNHTLRFVRAQRNISRAEPLQNMYARPICAEMFAERALEPDVLTLKRCENYLVKEEGFFSDFSGISALLIVSYLAMSSDPKQKLKDLQDARVLIRKHFPPLPDYVPLASIVLTEEESRDDWEPLVLAAEQVYKRLKADHRILSSGGDILFSLLIAKSGKDPEKVIADTKRCAEYLDTEHCGDPDSFRSLCRVLAMNGSDADESCSRYHALFNVLKAKGYKFGRNYQASVLALDALLPYDIEDIADDIIDVDKELARHEMYRGLVPKYSKTVRLMHAAMVVSGTLRPADPNAPGNDVTRDMVIAMDITMWTLLSILFI